MTAVTLSDEKPLKDQLALPILFADRVINSALESESSRFECAEISRQANRLSQMLRTAVRFTASPPSSTSIYDRPIRRISADVTKNLEKALNLVVKCKHTGILRHVFLTITSTTADFKKVTNLLESSIADLQWLLSLFENNGENNDVGIPPIASNDPILAWIWSSIASLYHHSKEKHRIESANHLASLARDNHRYRKAIVEEGGVPPLLRLLKVAGGSPETQIAAATALCNLADVTERTRAITAELGINVIVQSLGNSPIKVKIAVAELVAKIAEVDATAREEFGGENVMKPLMNCLMTDLNIENYDQIFKAGKKHTTIHSIVKYELNAKNDHNCNNNNRREKMLSSFSSSSSDNETPEIKHRLKINCALALWRLCDGSVLNSQKIAEPKGLFGLSKIVEVEKGELQLNCLMTIMEVAKVAEVNVELRKVAWKPSSVPAKAVLDQLIRVINEVKDEEFLIPIIKTLGFLARIFAAKETRVVKSLVDQLGNVNVRVATEAAIALVKFVCLDNHNRVEHSKTIIEFNGVTLLMNLMNLSDRSKMNAVVLLSYLSMHVGNSQALAEARALKILESAVRSGMAQNPELRDIFHRAIHCLVLYQDGAHVHPHSHSLDVV